MLLLLLMILSWWHWVFLPLQPTSPQLLLLLLPLWVQFLQLGLGLDLIHVPLQNSPPSKQDYDLPMHDYPMPN
jgi:hypothetical protein